MLHIMAQDTEVYRERFPVAVFKHIIEYEQWK